MRIEQWVAEQGRGEIARLARVTSLSYVSVHAICTGKSRPQYDNAVKISRATGGVVSVNELQEPPPPATTSDAPPPPPRRRTKSRRPKAAAA